MRMSCGSLIVVVLVVLVVNSLVGGLAVEYVVEYWATYIKGVPVDIPFLPCMGVGLFFGEFAIPLAFITWLFSFVL